MNETPSWAYQSPEQIRAMRQALGPPTLDDLLMQLSKNVSGRDAITEVARQVAAGERNTNNLPPNMVILACQSLYILMRHVKPEVRDRMSQSDSDAEDQTPSEQVVDENTIQELKKRAEAIEEKIKRLERAKLVTQETLRREFKV